MKNDDAAQHKKKYDTITALYDMIENLASTVESKFVKNQEEHFALIEPVINDVADSIDVLSEEYINVIENPKLKKAARLKVEKALRKIFMALENYRKQIAELGQDTLKVLTMMVNPIMEKIAKQTAMIVMIFMELMEISLDRIMQKHEMDEFRRNYNLPATSMMPQHSH